MIDLSFADSATYCLSDGWRKKTDEERLDLVKSRVDRLGFNDLVEITSAKENGQVFVRLIKKFPAKERGVFLLEVESVLKKEADLGITIWHEPIGDKSSLRNLRGIEVKS